MKLTSSGNVMLVTFSFSRQRDGAIFKAYFQAIPRPGHHINASSSLHHKSYAKLHIYINSHHLAGCGGSISSWNGSIYSPHYPSFYPPNIDCIWTVKVSHVTKRRCRIIALSDLHLHLPWLNQAPLPGYLISMTIVMMDIQDSPSSDGCEKDWLDIGGVK